MFATTNYAALFPTYLWIHQLAVEDYRPLNDALAAKLEALQGGRRLEFGQTRQTAQTFHRLAEAKPLVGCIESAVAEVLEFLKIQHKEMTVTGCWANIGAPGSQHKRHCHPNNYLSGVYYVRVPEAGNVIQFDDPRPYWQHVAPDVTEQTPENSNTITFTVKEGMLIVFPSWLFHYVPKNNSDEQRISISFNAMFTSFDDAISRTKWTGDVSLCQ